MAKAHFTHHRAQSSAHRGRRAPDRMSPSVARRSDVVRSRGRRPRVTSSPDPRRMEVAAELQRVAGALKVVYSACVTTELALRGQNADMDYEISVALHHDVTDAVSREAEKLSALVSRL